jgi:hypothetical protein
MVGRDELVDNRRKDADTAALAVLGRLDRQRRRVDQDAAIVTRREVPGQSAAPRVM